MRNENQCLICVGWTNSESSDPNSNSNSNIDRNIRFFYCGNKLLLFTGRVLFCRYIFNLFGVYVLCALFFISLFIHLCMCVMLLAVFYISIFSSHCLCCFLYVCVVYFYFWLLYDSLVSGRFLSLFNLYIWIKDRFFEALRIVYIGNVCSNQYITAHWIYHSSMEQWHIIEILLYIFADRKHLCRII